MDIKTTTMASVAFIYPCSYVKTRQLMFYQLLTLMTSRVDEHVNAHAPVGGAPLYSTLVT